MRDDEGVPDLRSVVTAYWRHHRLATSADRSDRLEADDWFWAWECVERAVVERADGLVELLVALADAVPLDEDALGSLGAGPFETLLCHEPRELASQLLDDLDAAARRNPNVRIAVQGISWYEDVDPEVRQRFQRFAPPP